MTPTRPRLAPALVQLESREVPALFYVDPLFAGVPNGTTVTFNNFGPNAVAGRVIGTDAFATLNAALTAAAANPADDTIYLARSRFDTDGGAVVGNELLPNVTPLDNSAGPIQINENITLVGSGRGATVLAPTSDTANANTGVFNVAAGKSFTVRDLTLDGGGKQIGIGLTFNGAGIQGTVERVEVTGIVFDPIFGTAIAAGNGARLTVTDSQVSGYGRIGISFDGSDGSVTDSAMTGKGAGTTFVNYGLQLSGGSDVVVTGNTITGHTATSAGNGLSAGVNLFELGGAAPTAVVSKNTISGNTFGVRVGGEFTVDRSIASIRSNNLNGNYLAVQADNNNTVDAVSNWYGDASGPFVLGTNPNGKGSEVTDQVTFTPWLTVPFTENVVEVPVPGPIQIIRVPADPLPIAPPPPPAGLAVGGSGQLTGLNGTLSSVLSTRPYGAGFFGEVRVARADVNKDGVADYITAAGMGGGPRVLVIDGATGGVLRDFYAYSPQFTGGVFVAGGDIDKDGYADIVTGAGGHGSTHVMAFSGRTGEAIRSFTVYDPRYIGGVTVAAGDLNGDGYAEIVAGTTVGGGPNVRTFDGLTGNLLNSFFAYDAQFVGGVFVAVGDLDGNGFAEIITGTGVGGGPNVRVFDGMTGTLRNSFLVGDANFVGGVRVGSQDLDIDGKDDLLFGLGAGGDNRARVTFGANLATGNFNPTAFTQPLFGSADGLFVG